MPEVGIVIPAHASALGKAMLAFSDDDERADTRRGALRSMTGETVTEPAELRDAARGGARDGPRHGADEAVIGECALAGAVFDSSGWVAGSIGVVVPSASWPLDAATQDAVRDAARAISRELGSPSWPARAG